ncbi:hypothetical protein [Arcobacter sp. F2176]|uniref:hypothetical protein n=1 Tax=Arcobacter sp. F2176 TaxID=2044511 RepID=UPI00100BD9D3|nr:hypothetical protein [Arcobacter sp. F2176]RXJ82704.1 hypothetical protein CRU95_01175 [Arcobacter sp. F2176]
MKKFNLLVLLSVLIISGCANVFQVKKDKPKEEVVTTNVEEKDNKKEEAQKKLNEKWIYYTMINPKTEIFVYNGNYSKNDSLLEDRQIKSSFYLSGKSVRISKIFDTKLGDRYGKIANKSLFISMDDLTTYKK